MSDFYENIEPISRPRTWGRGLHLINDKDKRVRRHARRFLNWYCLTYGFPKPITYSDGAMYIPGVIKDGWVNYQGKMVVGKRGFTVSSIKYPNIYPPDEITPIGFVSSSNSLFDIDFATSLHYSELDFQRDGIPNNYDKCAEIFDDMCLRKNKHFYAANHFTDHGETVEVRDALIELAVREYRDIKKREEARNLFKRYKKLTPREKDEFGDYADFIPNFRLVRWTEESAILHSWEFALKFKKFDSRFRESVISHTRNSRETSKNNARQLRALGFLA